MRTLLGEVMSFVQQHLVAHEDLKQIEYSASNGFLQRLDPHSLILEPRQYRDMKVTTRGEFGGLGFVITMRDGNLTVVRVLRNTPAQKAGIRAKDFINKIEEQSTINMDLNDAVDRLRGRPNTKVAITVSRAGWTEPKRLQLTARGDQLRDRLAGEAARRRRRLRPALAVLREHHARPPPRHRRAGGRGGRRAQGLHPRPARQPGRPPRPGHRRLRRLPLPRHHREDGGGWLEAEGARGARGRAPIATTSPTCRWS